MGLKDERLKVMNEVLNGIKVLKLYAWETSFKEKVDAVRNMELKSLLKFQMTMAVGNFSWSMSSILVS